MPNRSTAHALSTIISLGVWGATEIYGPKTGQIAHDKTFKEAQTIWTLAAWNTFFFTSHNSY